MVVQRTEQYGPDIGVEKEMRIQTGVLRRLFKEYEFYKSEAGKLQSKVDEMRAQRACIHDVRHMTDVQEESASMIPQVEIQIRTARAKLQEMIVRSTMREVQNGSMDQLHLDANRLIDATGALLHEDGNMSSTASPPTDEELAGVPEPSDDEY